MAFELLIKLGIKLFEKKKKKGDFSKLSIDRNSSTMKMAVYKMQGCIFKPVPPNEIRCLLNLVVQKRSDEEEMCKTFCCDFFYKLCTCIFVYKLVVDKLYICLSLNYFFLVKNSSFYV